MKREFITTVLLTGIMMTACSTPSSKETVSSETAIVGLSDITAEKVSDTIFTLELETAVVSSAEITTEPMTEPPKGNLDGIKLGIDPGHQAHGNSDQEAIAPDNPKTKDKVTSGAVGVSTSIPEYETNLEISLLLKSKLEAEGATVYMTRESHDVDISNQERAKMMNDYGVDLVLRIHCDSSTNPEAHGIGFYVSESNSIAEQSWKYAEIIQPIVCKAVDADNNGITHNDNYTGQNWSEVPCMMIECGFLSNPREDVLLNDPKYQDELTDGIVKGIVMCFDGKNKHIE